MIKQEALELAGITTDPGVWGESAQQGRHGASSSGGLYHPSSCLEIEFQTEKYWNLSAI